MRLDELPTSGTSSFLQEMKAGAAARHKSNMMIVFFILKAV
jgi:hypothetical protein